MPFNEPVLDTRGYKELASVIVMVVAFVLTVAYPDMVPLATYIIQPSASALRNTSILLTRSLINAIVWGVLAYFLVRVSERLRHKGR